MAETTIDPCSGFDPSTSIFHSKRSPVPLPSDPNLDVTTFILSLPHSDDIALIDASSGRQPTYADLHRSISCVASYLSSTLYIRKGQVVLVLSPNSLYFPIVSLAVMSFGAVLTTTNPLNTSQEISKQIGDSNLILVFTTEALVPKLSSCSRPLAVVLLEETLTASYENPRIVATIEDIIRTEPEPNRAREIVSQDDTATLLYSSGTTGTSKGVVSTHRTQPDHQGSDPPPPPQSSRRRKREREREGT